MTTAVATMNHDLMLAGPVGSLDAYIQAVGGIPVISKEDEQALAIRFREEEDLDAARSLVMAHLRFVVHIAKGYNGYGLPIADLIQEGNVGLMKAVKRFDPEFGVRLVSFAVHWIRAEIHEFVLKNWRIVKVATTKSRFFSSTTGRMKTTAAANAPHISPSDFNTTPVDTPRRRATSSRSSSAATTTINSQPTPKTGIPAISCGIRKRVRRMEVSPLGTLVSRSERVQKGV